MLFCVTKLSFRPLWLHRTTPWNFLHGANAVLNVLITVFFPGGFALAIFKDVTFYIYAGIFAIMLVLAFKKVHPIIIICLSAVLGIAVGYLV